MGINLLSTRNEVRELKMERHQREELLAAWLEAHRGLVLKVVLAYAERAEREDLFQEIWLTLWLAMEDYAETAKPSTFIYRVALNRAMNWHRARRRYRERVETWAVLPELAQDPREREQLAALYAAIQQLDKLDRALVLLWLDQLSYREMAEIHGLNESSVGARLSRARQKLAALLEEDNR